MLRMATNITTIGRRKIGQKGRITTISSVHYYAAEKRNNNPPCPSPFSLAVQQPIVVNHHHQQQQHKYYSSTSRNNFAAAAAWWNPFSRGDKSTTYVSSGKTTTSSSSSTDKGGEENPRKIQERKDAMLVALALKFRKLSLENPTLARDALVDMSFDSLELEELDNKTQMQLRRYVQQSLDGQILDLFQTFQIVDDSLKPMSDDYDDDMNYTTLYNQMLEVELERTIDALADPNPIQAPKGPSSKQFLELKRGALETLLQNRKEQQQLQQDQKENETTTTTTTTKPPEEDKSDNDDDDGKRRVTWVDADNFGFHESSIDPDRNRLIRHYQTVNLCRSAKMREEWGFSVLALQSSVAGAGRGIYVDGYAKAGSILAFQPGQVWAREHMMNLSLEDQRQLQTNDNYQMSLRYDDFMIDSRKSPYTVLTEPNSNLMALGHIVNHPTPSKPPNCRSIMVNFTQELDLEKLNLDRYIPNTYAKPRNLGLVGTLMHGGTGDSVEIMQSLCLIATRDVCNEELFYDYRLLTPQRPQWYHVVEDTAFVDNNAEEEEKENSVVPEKKDRVDEEKTEKKDEVDDDKEDENSNTEEAKK